MPGSISTIVLGVKNGSSSARKEVEAALKRIDESEDYNALISVIRERALERANEIDQKIASGEDAGSLAGVTFVAKDNFLAFGAPTTAASRILENFEAPLQATAIEKLEAEGAICVGKANLDAFAHGGSTENSAFGPAKNAHDKTKVAGGSSGGSAVAVALGLVPFALGTDTGGSIRQPASFNGVYGFKPTYGAVSRYGVVSMASSTDTIGCFANTAQDVDAVMGVLAGQDEKDMTTLADFYTQEAVKPKQKIGLIRNFLSDGVDGDVRSATLDFVEQLRKAGHEVEEVDLEMAKYSLAIYYIITSAEISSNMARYDGVRYGLRAGGESGIQELIGRSREAGLTTENKRRIILGSYVLSSGYYDAYYLKAQKARTLLIDEFSRLFESFDALISPVAPTPAFGLGERIDDPIKMYLTDAMTAPVSLAGLPALSVPVGRSKSGLPTGVQLIGPRKSDLKLLALADSLEGRGV